MKLRIFPILLLSLFVLTRNSHAQGTAFTYNGRLNAGGGPANGSYDLSFTLFPASSGGPQAAAPATNTATAVSNGLFTVTLDFGTGVFNGMSYWLEIGVRTNGNGSFTTLTPRQPITPVPYAIYSENSASLNGQASTNFAPVSGSTAYVAKVGDTMTGTLNLPTDSLVAGGNQLVLSGGKVGIGTTTPGAKLDVSIASGNTSLSSENGALHIGNANGTANNFDGIFFKESNGNPIAGILGMNVAHGPASI